jgi:WD40 repeat protein
MVAFSPDGRLLATSWCDHTVRLCDTVTGQLHALAIPRQSDLSFSILYPYPVAFSPDGKLLAFVSPEGFGTAQLLETATGRRHGPPLGHSVTAVAFSPDSGLLATGSQDRMVQLWETTTGRPYGPPLRHQGGIRVVAFSPDGRLLATGSWDRTVRLWEAATGKPHGPPLRLHIAALNVAFSPNGRLLATPFDEGIARLWETGTGEPCGPPLPAGGSVTFSPNGKLLATASAVSAAVLWPVPSAPADLREMELRTWVALGARLDAAGGVEAIPWQEWQQLRDELHRHRW